MNIVQGRGLLDSILGANEVMDDIRRKRKSVIIVKVDFEKAYDLDKWKFLFYRL